MIQEFALNAGHVAFGILVLNAILLLWKFGKMPIQVKVVGIYFFAALAAEISSRFLFSKGDNNLYLLHYYTMLEFVAWSIFYWYLLQDVRWFRKFLPYFVGGVMVLLVLNSVYLEPLTSFNSNAKTLTQIILISYAIYYFFISFGKIDLAQPYHRAMSFINFAVILYFSGSLFIFMFSKLLVNNEVARVRQHGFWAIHAMLYLIFQVLILYSLWKVAFRKMKYS